MIDIQSLGQSRSGNQLPFSSINYGTCTLPEGQMVIEAILDVTIKGLGEHGVTSIFPCGIFQYKKGVNNKPGTPNYYLFRKALKSTAKRIYPNYANCNWSNQEAWKKYDLKIRTDVINELNEEDTERLIAKVKHNPEYALDHFRLIYDYYGLHIVDEELPIELFSTMGCRTASSNDINFKDSFEKNLKAWLNNEPLYDDIISACQKDGRGNICPVTIILPTLAMESKEYVEKKIENPSNEDYNHLKNGNFSISEEIKQKYKKAFISLLTKKIHEAKDMLIERFEHISSQSAASAKFMYGNKTMAGYVPKEGIRSALRHGTLAIGQIGLAEALIIIIGKDHSTDEGMEFAIEIETLYKDLCAKFKEEYKLNFGNYFSPGESLCHTSLIKFRNKYGIIPNVSDKEYFTNSMHIPVHNNDINIFEKIDKESKLTGYSSAGCITYVEMNTSALNNIDAMEEVVNYAMDKDIPYFAINFELDRCADCNYQAGEFGGVCPKCGSKNIMELRRVTGYISTTKKHFNNGKIDEVDHRSKHEGKQIL